MRGCAATCSRIITIATVCCRDQRERRLAEREGFEPPVPFRVQWFSRPPPSTTRPPLLFLSLGSPAPQLAAFTRSDLTTGARIRVSAGDAMTEGVVVRIVLASPICNQFFP